MIGKSHGQIQPTALGTLTNASTYGLAIPTIYGMTKVSMLGIWAANLREGGSGKKWKNKKKGITTYVENIDFLLGSNPIIGVNQMWSNATKLPLNFTSVSFNDSPTGAVPGSYTITDAEFYSVIGVTWVATYSVTFNDYGGYGSVTDSGTFEIPLWNENLNGPNPTDSNGYRLWPYVYYWQPGTNVVSFPVGGLGNVPTNVTGCKIYYTQKSSALKNVTPLAFMRCTFEPTLADGPEYSPSWTSQQTLAPPYAGIGSPNFDLGSGAVIPDTRAEVQGSHSIYSTGDADFADMIVDIAASGLAQISPADATATMNQQQVQHGASLFDFPGVIQKRILSYTTSIGNPQSLSYRMPNVAGNVLLMCWVGFGGGAITGVLDDATDTWIPIDIVNVGSLHFILAYAVSLGSPAGNRVFPQMGGNYGNTNTFWIAELPPGFTFDTSVASNVSPWSGGAGKSVTIATGNQQGQPAFLIGFGLQDPGGSNPTNFDPNWKPLMGIPQAQYNSFIAWGETRTVWAPGNYYLQDNITSGSGRIILASFIQSSPSTVPQSLGALVDQPSLEICRTQARAYGLWGSLATASQKPARDWMANLYESMNSAPFFSQGVLKQMPYGEASAVGNGAIYTSPYASGPIDNLSIQSGGAYGDFLGDADNPPVKINRKARIDAPSFVRFQINNRSSDYNPVTVSQPNPGNLALYGVRNQVREEESPELREEISTVATAQTLITIKANVESAVLNGFSFKLGPSGLLYEPMDLVTLTDPTVALDEVPVWFNSVEIGADWSCTCEATPYIYGVHSPLPPTGGTAAVTPNVQNPNADPGLVNTPIIFEPVPRLYGSASQAQLWAVISSNNANYGGCIPYVSTDGGNSYNQVGSGTGIVTGSAITGVSTADWPAASDPDTTNNLPLDLTESNGVLGSYLAADRDAFTYPCYIAAGGATIPYGLMTYNSATMTATSKYTLNATGSGNELRRCVFGAPVTAPGPDVDHPNGSRWAFLGNPSQQNAPGTMKVTMDPTWIGKTLYFKFLAINTFGNAIDSLADCTAYTFTPTGQPGGGIVQNQTYSQSPAIALSQTNATTIAMVQVTSSFGSNKVNYNARTFTIPNPGGTPTTYYVTIADPGYVGDTGATTNLTPTISTSDALVGVPGNTYIGSIVAVGSMFGTLPSVATAGGYPVQPTILVNGTPVGPIVNINDTTPAAGSGYTNNKFQQDAGTPTTNVSSEALTGAGLRSVSANFNVNANDGTIEVTTGSSTITATVVDGTTLIGNPKFTIAKVDSGTGSVELSMHGGQTINGQTTWNLGNQWQYITFQWDGVSNYTIVGNN